MAKENQKTTSDFDALEPRKRGCSPLLTPKGRATPEKTEDLLTVFSGSADLKPLSLATLDSSPKGAIGMATKFPAQPQSVRSCPLPLGGAVAQRLRGYKWRSEKSVKAIAPTGAALAFLCFDFFFRIVKGEQPLARCGVGGVQR